MKKFLVYVSAIFILTLFSTGLVYAGKPDNAQKPEYKAQLKQKRQVINQNSENIKKLELQIDDKSAKLSQVIMKLFDRELPLGEDKLSRITNLQEALVKDAEQIAVTKRSIRRVRKEASILISEENYALALSNYDKVIELQEKEIRLLQAFDKNILGFIDMLDSLQNK